MGDHNVNSRSAAEIDWRDIRAALVIGLVYATLLALKFKFPASGVQTAATNLPFILTVSYIIWRARKEPEKLDTWGITSPITTTAMILMAAFIAVTTGLLGTTAHMLGGELRFELAYVFRMLDYIIGAFPQQFFLCSVGFTSLATLPALSGTWRLPLVVGICFGLAHFWSPTHIPGTSIPIQMIATAPMGFFAAWYFLRFQTILPLTAFHAIAYVLFSKWVEKLL